MTARLRAAHALTTCALGTHISHHTAAVLWDGWLPDDPDIHVSAPPGAARTQRRGIRVHEVHAEAQVVMHRGLRVSGPAQSFLDLGRDLPLVDLVVLGDSLVHRGHIHPRELIAAAEAWRGPGARRARRAAGLVRAGVDSPMESRLRLLIVLAGLPEPVVNHTLYRSDGSWWIRFDLSWPAWKVAVEYDGRHHAESAQQWQHDIERREQLDHIDWRLVVVRSPGIYVEPHVTLDRVARALRDRGVHVTVREAEWRRHFPGRRAAA